jgi:dTDP-4-dehydrorhamnose 3,5-epimerase
VIQSFIPDYFSDERGDLWTIWNENNSPNNLKFNHDKVAISKKNVLRGLHGDSKSWKLITCLSGEIFLAVVDYRKDSETYLKTETFILNDKNKQIVLVPPFFLNGHYVISDSATFFYKWAYEGGYPDVNEQFSVNWFDPKLNINWPTKDPILSDRDKKTNFII